MAYPSNQPDYVSIDALTKPQKERLKHCIKELNDSMTRVSSERDFQKEAINNIHDELGVDKKIVRRMAKAYYNSNYQDVVEENKKFQDFYEGVMDGVL